MAFHVLLVAPGRWKGRVLERPRSSYRVLRRTLTLRRGSRAWRACLSVSGGTPPKEELPEPESLGATASAGVKRPRRPLILGALALIALTLLVRHLWQQPWLHARIASIIELLVTLTDQYGPMRVSLAFAVLHFVAIVLCFPASALIEIAAGYALGFPLGFVSMHLSKVAAAVACFWLGRTVLLGYVQKQSERFPRFRHWLGIVRQEGPAMMLYMRLSPVPSFLNNYLLAAVGVRFTDFLWTTTLGIIPGLLPLVGGGVGARDLSLLSIGAEGGLPKAAVPTWAHLLRLGSTFVGIVLFVGLLVRLYRQRLESRAPVLTTDPTIKGSPKQRSDARMEG